MKRLIIKIIFSLILTFTIHLCQGQTWNSVGTLTDVVLSLHEYNGELVASGGGAHFDSIHNLIAKWNGSSWDSLDAGIGNQGVYDFSIFNNDLIIGGGFTSVDTLIYSRYVARWDGSRWWQMSTGCPGCTVPFGTVYATEVYNGELYVAGNITSLGPLNNVKRIAKWDGSGWQHVGGGVTGGIPTIYCMAVYNGELYAGGEFYSAGGVPVNNIAKWNGTQWSAVGNGLNSFVRSLVVDTINNVLYAGGSFLNSGAIPVHCVAKWDGNAWSQLGNGIPETGLALCMYHNELFAGIFAATIYDTTFFRWDGTLWHPIVPCPPSTIFSMAVYNDELYVGGYFYTIGNDSITMLGRYYSPAPNGFEEMKKNEIAIRITPNPFTQKIKLQTLNFKLQSKKTIAVYDIIGAKVYEKELLPNQTAAELNLSFLQQGVYFLTLKSNGESYAKKIVKM